MKNPAPTLLVFTGLLLCVGCATRSPQTDAVRTFKAPEQQVVAAITNALASGRYDGMVLSEAAGHDYLTKGWHPTNGFLLQPGTSTAYRGYFHIVPVALDLGTTAVTVRTVFAETIAGKEPGVHGGWAFHFKRMVPDPTKEEQVLSAIARQMNGESQ